MISSFEKAITPGVYAVTQRGTKVPLRTPRAGTSGAPGGMPVQNDVSVVGAKLISKSGARRFLEFQNHSAIADMSISFGIAPLAITQGDLISAGGSVRWEVEVPSEDLFVFCGVAGEPFSWQERLAV